MVLFAVSLPGAARAADRSHEALQKAAVLVQEGRLEEAEQQARLALSDPAARAVAHSVLGVIRLQQDRLAEGAALLEEAVRLEPGLLGAQLSLAQVYLKTGDRASAAALAGKWKRLADRPPAASVQLSRLLAEGGLVSEAIDVLEHARREDPSSYELAFALGGARLLNDDPARALEAYDRALDLRPESVPALREAATVAERHGELERALSYLLRARKIERDDPEILLHFGRVCLKMDLLDDADGALTRAASLRPKDPAYQYTLATAKVGKKQFEEAQRLLEPLVESRPADARLQYALGSVLYTRGYLEESAERLRESLRLQPEQLASRYYLALVARDRGLDAEAVSGLEELLRRYPDHGPSCEVLGGLLVGQQRYAEAETFLRKAIQLDPLSMKANYQLGLLLARTGRKEEAARQLALASTLREGDEEASRLQLRLLDPGP